MGQVNSSQPAKSVIKEYNDLSKQFVNHWPEHEKLLIKSQKFICGHLNRGQMVYVCRTCQRTPSGAFCITCWKPEKHIGHEYGVGHDFLGYCMCGDSERCEQNGFCDVHNGKTSVDEELRRIPEAQISWIEEFATFQLKYFALFISFPKKGQVASKENECRKMIHAIIDSGDVGRRIVAKAFCDREEHAIFNQMKRKQAQLDDTISILLPDFYFRVRFVVKSLEQNSKSGEFEKMSRPAQLVFGSPYVCRELLQPSIFKHDKLHFLHILLIQAIRNSVSLHDYVMVAIAYVFSSSMDSAECVLKDEALLVLFVIFLQERHIQLHVGNIPRFWEFHSYDHFFQDIFKFFAKALDHMEMAPIQNVQTFETASKTLNSFRRELKRRSNGDESPICCLNSLLPYVTSRSDGKLVDLGSILNLLFASLYTLPQNTSGNRFARSIWSNLLPLHRFTSVIITAILSFQNINQVSTIIPRHTTREQKRILNLPFLRMKSVQYTNFIFPNNHWSPRFHSERQAWYEMSGSKECDMCFLQTTCCAIGASEFARDLFNSYFSSAILAIHSLILIATQGNKPAVSPLRQAAICFLASAPRTHGSYIKHLTYCLRCIAGHYEVSHAHIETLFNELSEREKTKRIQNVLFLKNHFLKR